MWNKYLNRRLFIDLIVQAPKCNPGLAGLNLLMGCPLSRIPRYVLLLKVHLLYSHVHVHIIHICTMRIYNTYSSIDENIIYHLRSFVHFLTMYLSWSNKCKKVVCLSFNIHANSDIFFPFFFFKSVFLFFKSVFLFICIFLF